MIIRTNKTSDYTIISNAGLNDSRLSLQAKGLYAFLLSKPDGWNITVNGLYSQLNEGRDTVRKILKELEIAGYIQHETGRSAGRFSSSMTLLESPLLKTSTENQERSTSTGFPTQVSTNINTKSNIVTDASPSEAKEAAALLFDFIHKRNPRITNKQTVSWAQEIDKINRIDGYTWDEIIAVINWCQADTFWQNNILSGAKLRKQMAQLVIRMESAIPKKRMVNIDGIMMESPF